MVNIISGDSHNLKDVQNFLNLIDKLEENKIPEDIKTIINSGYLANITP
jgi:hypothetical protein